MTIVHLNVYFQRENKKPSIHLIQIYEKHPDNVPADLSEHFDHFYRQHMVENRSIFNMLISHYRNISGEFGIQTINHEIDREIERAVTDYTEYYYKPITLPLSADSRDLLQMIAAVEGALHQFTYDDHRKEALDSRIYYHDTITDFSRVDEIIQESYSAVSPPEKIFSRECAAWLVAQIKENPDELADYQKIRIILEAMLANEVGSLVPAIKLLLNKDPAAHDTMPEYMKLLPKPPIHISPRELQAKRVEVEKYIVDNPGIVGLQKLTADILKYSIARDGGLELKDVTSLAKTCTHLHRIFQPEVQQRALEILLQHVVRGEQEEALKMIQKNPGLLLLRGGVTDYSGRKIEGVTALQCAYGAEDTVMCKMILSEMKSVMDGEKASSDQLDIKFTRTEEIGKKYFAGLAAVTSKERFLNDELSDATKEALNKFRLDLSPRIINNGLFHFNIHNLINAVEVYREHYDKWTEMQRKLYWQKIAGYLERFLPACYAQVLCQGLENVVRDNEPIKRELKLQEDRPYYPLDTKRSNRLGYDFAVYSESIVRGAWGSMTFPPMTVIPKPDQAKLFCDYLSLLSANKTAELHDMCQTLKESKKDARPCVIC